MDRKRIIPLLFISLLACNTPIQAEDDDFGVWTTVTAEKKIDKKWSATVEGEYRTHDGVSTTDRWSAGISAEYKITKWLKADAGYSFLHSYKEEEVTKKGNIVLDYWQPRHRVNVSLTGSLEWKRFKFSLRERWQYTYRPQKFVEKYASDGVTRMDDEQVKGKAEHMMRSRLQVEYDIAKCPLTPYASCELYHNLDGIDKTRWTVGTEYKINKKHAVEVCYRYQNKADEDETNGHVLGIGYKFKF